MTCPSRPTSFPSRTVWEFGVLLCLSYTLLTAAAKCLTFTAELSSTEMPSPSGGQAARSGVSTEKSLETALAEGKDSDAQALLRLLLNQNPTYPEILLKAGLAFAERGLYANAALAFKRCTEEYPEIFEAHYDLALADFARRQYPQALRALDTASTKNRPEQIALLYLRGKVEDALGESDEARKNLAAAFLADPSEENYALDLGIYDLQHNAYPQAEQVFAQAQKFHPHSVFTGLGLALAQYLSGQPTDSILTCREFLSERPDFAPIRTLLAFAFYMRGAFREADEVARKGLKLPGPHPYLYYLDVAVLLKLHSRDYDRMLNEISVAEQQIPACSLCYLAQSRIDDGRGARQAAIRDAKRATDLDPAFSEAWYRLAMLYDQTGQHGNAAHARMRFAALKAAKSQKESGMLRSAFIGALVGSGK
jgi:tetratricopeptide (TPR) repeat protein